jgi:hypothetical protein
MAKKKKFHVWAKDGKYYYKGSRLSRKKEITKEEFKKVLENETITSLGFAQKQSLGLFELFQHFNAHNKAKTSEFGRRIQVVLLEEKQTISTVKGGVDVYFKLDILDEETGEEADDLFTITSTIEGVTGPLTDSGSYYPELFRSFYQLAFNGYLANNEEANTAKKALGR